MGARIGDHPLLAIHPPLLAFCSGSNGWWTLTWPITGSYGASVDGTEALLRLGKGGYFLDNNNPGNRDAHAHERAKKSGMSLSCCFGGTWSRDTTEGTATLSCYLSPRNASFLAQLLTFPHPRRYPFSVSHRFSISDNGFSTNDAVGWMNPESSQEMCCLSSRSL